MDGKLVFCNDGVLRFKSLYNDNTLIPLTTIQSYQNENDYQFFIKLLKDDITIEKNTTLGNILLALEPWKEVVKNIVGLDVPAYINYIKKPSNAENFFDYISIQNNVEVSRDFDYGNQSVFDFDTISEYLNSRESPVPLDTFNINSTYDICGYNNNSPSNHSIIRDISGLKNIPVVFNDKAYLVNSKSESDDSKTIFNENVLGVKICKSFGFIKGYSSISFMNFLTTIFNKGLFYNKPEDAAIATEYLKKEILEGLSELEDMSESGEPIIVAERSFDDMYYQIRVEIEEWNKIIKYSSSKDKNIIRIGDLEEAKSYEERIYGEIIE